MPAPFGGHPLFLQYLQWATGQGCKVQSGIQSAPNGKVERLTKISAPSGRWVIAVGIDQREFLVPTMIAYLDRRLGLKSPFFSIDPGPES
jgi:hypothetical protein